MALAAVPPQSTATADTPLAVPVGTLTPAAKETVARVPAARAPRPTQRVAAAAATYRVSPGVTFNNPLTATGKRAIIGKINSAINHTPRGGQIRIFTWSIWTKAGVTAAINAHQRGVTVRVILDRENVQLQPNPHVRRLRLGLATANNSKRPPERRSGVRLCDRSCRGKAGRAHSKFMLFSQAGRSKYIYMHGSANWGDAAAARQWNDLYTFVDRKPVYDTATAVFDQAYRDRPVPSPWTEYTSPGKTFTLAWAPTTATSRANDRLVATLSRVKCRGAIAPAGNASHRTIIRVAPDVLRNDYGMTVARHLRRLWDAGCDVKVGYTVIGVEIKRYLSQPGGRGPVPLRHLANDFDGDGAFDRYFHLKVYTINGVIGSNRSAYWMVQGSANTSSSSLGSDETFTYITNRRAVTVRYQKHIDYWYTRYPATS